MGKLKEGVTYIYERAEGITYAREMGSSTRQIIGYDYPNDKADANEWNLIRLAGKTNPALQHAIDRVIMLYRLSTDHGQ